MGFFSRIGDALSRVKDFVIDVKDTIADKAQDIKWWMEDKLDSIFGSTSQYDENSSALDTAKIQKRLTEMRTQNERNIAKYTEIFQDALADNFISILDDMRVDSDLVERYNINIASFQNDIDKVVNTMSESLKQLFAKRISLDDDECLDILKIYDDDDRRKEQINFAKKVLNEGKTKLVKEFKISSDKLFNRLYITINKALNDNDYRLRKSNEELRKLRDGERQEKTEVLIQAQIAYDTCVIAKNCLKPSA